ncbi:MAG: hypothetical protein QOI10_1833 [Solirubrobacterales bacterium]|jgi:hypothetical protein|nr:hypothetical protein [Solirubrobacterales bacterium]
MQVNRTGYLLFALFGGGGTAFIVAGLLIGGEVESTFVLIGGIWVAVTLGLVVYGIRQARQGRHEQWLWRTGLKGRGTLVSAHSGAEINEQPLMTLELDLDVPGQPPRRVKRKLIISEFAAYLMQPGLVLPVYVNPRDPDDILVVW